MISILSDPFLVSRYAQYGEVTPKIDVYAFGVVLYELISAKEAIVKRNESTTNEAIGVTGLVIDYLLIPAFWLSTPENTSTRTNVHSNMLLSHSLSMLSAS